MHEKVDNQLPILYTIDDIRQIFKIGRNKALALLASKGFPSFKINKQYYVEKKALEDWITKNVGKNFYC